MPVMRARILGSFILGLVAAACGGSMEADHVKTPDELIAEEEAKGAEQLKNQRDGGDYDTDNSSAETDEDKRRGWDTKQADIEMHRAANSAESCPESVTEKSPKGMAGLTVTFGNDGRVKSATLNEPYGEDTAVGKCVLRAMQAVNKRSIGRSTSRAARRRSPVPWAAKPPRAKRKSPGSSRAGSNPPPPAVRFPRG